MNRKVQLFGASIDVVRMPEAVSRFDRLGSRRRRRPLPVRRHAQHHPCVDALRKASFRDAYAVADMTLADGIPSWGHRNFCASLYPSAS